MRIYALNDAEKAALAELEKTRPEPIANEILDRLCSLGWAVARDGVFQLTGVGRIILVESRRWGNTT